MSQHKGKRKELAILLAGTLAATAPVFAKHGADDGPGTSGTAGTSGTMGTSGTAGTGGTSGTSGTGATNGTAGTGGTSGTVGTGGTGGTAGTSGSAGISGRGLKLSGKLEPQTSSFAPSSVTGKFKYDAKKNGKREDLLISVKIKGHASFDKDTAEVWAVFSDGLTCELELDDEDSRSNRFEYRLKLRKSKGEVQERAGSCEGTPATPMASSGTTVSIQVDEDNDPSTPNAEVLTGQF